MSLYKSLKLSGIWGLKLRVSSLGWGLLGKFRELSLDGECGHASLRIVKSGALRNMDARTVSRSC